MTNDNKKPVALLLPLADRNQIGCGYDLEKLSSAIRSLVWLMRTPDASDTVHMGAWPAVQNTLKVYAAMSGVQWTPELADAVCTGTEADWKEFDAAATRVWAGQ